MSTPHRDQLLELLAASRFEEALGVDLSAPSEAIDAAVRRVCHDLGGGEALDDRLDAAAARLKAELDKPVEKGHRCRAVGRQLSRGGHHASAIPYLTQAAKSCGDVSDYHWLGVALSEAGRAAEAVHWLEKVVELRGDEDDLAWLREVQDVAAASPKQRKTTAPKPAKPTTVAPQSAPSGHAFAEGAQRVAPAFIREPAGQSASSVARPRRRRLKITAGVSAAILVVAGVVVAVVILGEGPESPTAQSAPATAQTTLRKELESLITTESVPATAPPAVTTSTSAEAVAAAYAIGDTGPAGGLIFYDKGDDSGGWRYLEAAPAEAGFASVPWYPPGVPFRVISDARGIAAGTGYANTAAIIAALGTSGYAAELCVDMTWGGYSDWFLPSADECSLMLANLGGVGLGGFDSGNYWSSSQDTDGAVYFVPYTPDTETSGSTDFTVANARAIRAFSSAEGVGAPS